MTSPRLNLIINCLRTSIASRRTKLKHIILNALDNHILGPATRTLPGQANI